MVEAISINNLVKKYPRTEALKDISLSVRGGEFFALLGPNGAGKTTTINILTGLTNMTSGKIELFGKDVIKDYKEARSLIGLVPQEFNFDAFEKVYNILFFSAGYFGIPNKQREPRIKKILQELNLWGKRNSKALTLSGGMKRKLMIARALIHQPKILILDEPTAGVDVETRKAIWSYMKKLNKEGVTILLTTHYIEEAEQLCERIAIINQGKIIKLDYQENLMGLFEEERVTLYLSDEIKKIPSSLMDYRPSLKGKKLSLSLTSEATWEEFLIVLARIKLPIKKIETHKNKLEEIFIQLTKNDK